jgi:hypothetical protein
MPVMPDSILLWSSPTRMSHPLLAFHPGLPVEHAGGDAGAPGGNCWRGCRRCWRGWLGLALVMVLPGMLRARERAEYALELKDQLVQKIMPYWYDTAIDRKYGGYLLSDDASRKAPPATEKQLVTQSRMIWGFSHAHLRGLSDGIPVPARTLSGPAKRGLFLGH